MKLKPVRIGLWDQYGGSMPSGWVRWILEQYEFPYERAFPAALDAGNLNAKFDVLIFVDDPLGEAVQKVLREQVPKAGGKLVGELQLRRDVSHAPLFQVVFALQNVPVAPFAIPGLELVPIAVDNGTAKFDLTATVVPAVRSAFVTWKLPLPTTPKACPTPSRASADPTSSATVSIAIIPESAK